MLVDTSVISLTRKPERNSDIIAWLEGHRPNGLLVPAPVIAEISYGVEKVQQPSIRAMYEAWFRLILDDELIVAMDVQAFRLYGQMLACPALANFRITQPGSRRPQLAFDLQIAAIAIVRGEAVATLNGRDFARIQAAFPALRYLNPRAAAGGSEAA